MNMTQSYKWLITICNPIENGYTHEIIESVLSKMKSITYYCLSDETACTGTFHTHIFIYSESGISFSTLLDYFNGCHFDIVHNTCWAARNYVFKAGKWLNFEEKETNHRDSHIEHGEMPIDC